MVSVHANRSARPGFDSKNKQKRGLIPQRSSQRVAESRSVNGSLASGALGESNTETDDTTGNENVTEEDNSSAKDDDGDQENSEEPEESTLPRVSTGYGRGKGKGLGKGPGIRVHPVREETPNDSPKDSTPMAGLSVETNSSPLKRKRRESNMSTGSVLEDGEPSEYPRRKFLKNLKHTTQGLLAYQEDDGMMDESDDNYDGVNNISDSEDNEDEIEMVEEEAILDTAMFRRSTFGNITDEALNAVFNHNMMEDFIQRDVSLADEATSPVADSRKYSDSSAKRVRFKDEVLIEDFDESSSSSSGSDEFDSAFPDLFVDQASIPEKYYDDPASDSENSYWDFEDDRALNEETQLEDGDEFDEDEDSDVGSSGYETDGDTTDEEEIVLMPPPSRTPNATSVLSRPSSAAGSQIASPSPFRRTPNHSARKGPRIGKFEVDPCKVSAYADATGKNIAFEAPQFPMRDIFYFPVTESSSSDMMANSPQNTMLQQPFDESDFSESQVGADTLFAGLLPAFSNQGGFGALGPFGSLQDFAPGPDGLFSDVAADMLIRAGEHIHEDEEAALGRFIDFKDDTDDESDIPHFSSTPAPLKPEESATETPIVRRNTGQSMLEHLDSLGGSVTSFRNNQHRSRDVAQLPADPDLRASTAKPVRSGKSAEAPITPARRRRSSMNPRAGPTLDSSPLLHRPNAAISKRAPMRGPRMGTFA